MAVEEQADGDPQRAIMDMPCQSMKTITIIVPMGRIITSMGRALQCRPTTAGLIRNSGLLQIEATQTMHIRCARTPTNTPHSSAHHESWLDILPTIDPGFQVERIDNNHLVITRLQGFSTTPLQRRDVADHLPFDLQELHAPLLSRTKTIIKKSSMQSLKRSRVQDRLSLVRRLRFQMRALNHLHHSASIRRYETTIPASGLKHQHTTDLLRPLPFKSTLRTTNVV